MQYSIILQLILEFKVKELAIIHKLWLTYFVTGRLGMKKLKGEKECIGIGGEY